MAHGKKSFMCSSCEAAIKTNLKPEIHEESVHQIGSFSCDECKYEPKEMDNVKKHKKSVHQKSNCGCDDKKKNGHISVGGQASAECQETDGSIRTMHQQDMILYQEDTMHQWNINLNDNASTKDQFNLMGQNPAVDAAISVKFQ